MNDLESQVLRLTLANRRWKMLAIGLFACVCLFSAVSMVRARALQAQAEQARAAELRAIAASELHRDMVKQP